MAYPKHLRRGATFICKNCGTEFYRNPAQIKATIPIACSRACLAEVHRGSGNPFWNRTHTDSTRAKISASRKGQCVGNSNAKGYKHTEEAKKRIADRSRRLWDESRNMMLERQSRSPKRFRMPPELRRYRKQFTARQRREFTGDRCAYCGTADHLELDHIIPIFDGGTNDRTNAQTLCRGCNLFKTQFVDLPRYYAALAKRGDH